MNTHKLNKILGVKNNTDTGTPKEDNTFTELIKNDDSNDVILYTKNEKILKEVNNYIDERVQNISQLKKARDILTKTIEGKTMDLYAGADNKDIDAAAKAVNSLSTIIKQLDEIMAPGKVERFYEEVQEIQEESKTEITNQQINVYNVTPKELTELISEETKNNGEISQND